MCIYSVCLQLTVSCAFEWHAWLLAGHDWCPWQWHYLAASLFAAALPSAHLSAYMKNHIPSFKLYANYLKTTECWSQPRMQCKGKHQSIATIQTNLRAADGKRNPRCVKCSRAIGPSNAAVVSVPCLRQTCNKSVSIIWHWTAKVCLCGHLQRCPYRLTFSSCSQSCFFSFCFKFLFSLNSFCSLHSMQTLSTGMIYDIRTILSTRTLSRICTRCVWYSFLTRLVCLEHHECSSWSDVSAVMAWTMLSKSVMALVMKTLFTPRLEFSLNVFALHPSVCTCLSARARPSSRSLMAALVLPISWERSIHAELSCATSACRAAWLSCCLCWVSCSCLICALSESSLSFLDPHFLPCLPCNAWRHTASRPLCWLWL